MKTSKSKPKTQKSNLAECLERYRNIIDDVSFDAANYCYGIRRIKDDGPSRDRCPINRDRPGPPYLIKPDEIDWLNEQFYPLVRQTIHKYIPEQAKDVLEGMDIGHKILSGLSAETDYDKYRNEKILATDYKILKYIDKWMQQILNVVKSEIQQQPKPTKKKNKEKKTKQKPPMSQPGFQNQWAVIFGVHRTTIQRWIENKNKPFEQVSSRKWSLPLDEIPAEHLQKYQDNI